MLELKIYNKEMQHNIEEFFQKCFTELGWQYEPAGRHSDIIRIQEMYMKNGCMWCLFDNEKLVGTVAVRIIDKQQKVAEIKRLYLLKDYQGSGYGRQLFDRAVSFCKENAFSKVCLDTRNDRYASLHMIRKSGFKEIQKYNDNEFAELFFELKL